MICRLAGTAFLVVLVLSGVQAQKKPAKPAEPGPAEAMAGSFTHFSATMSGGILKESPKKVYRSGDLMRVELTNNYHLTDLRKRMTWSVHPERCALFPGPDAAVLPFAVMPGFKVERSSSDEKEIIDGHPCKMENAIYTHIDGGPRKTIVKLWRADDLQGFPVRVDVETSSTSHYTFNFTDVSLEPPDPALFKLQAKCKDFRTPEEKGSAKKPAAKPSKPPPTPPKP